jgi:hypothetical protein
LNLFDNARRAATLPRLGAAERSERIKSALTQVGLASRMKH